LFAFLGLEWRLKVIIGDLSWQSSPIGYGLGVLDRGIGLKLEGFVCCEQSHHSKKPNYQNTLAQISTCIVKNK
jgi:hypothetical protein